VWVEIIVNDSLIGQYIESNQTCYLLVGYVSNSLIADLGIFILSLMNLSQGMSSGSAGGKMLFIEEPERENALLFLEKFKLTPDRKCQN